MYSERSSIIARLLLGVVLVLLPLGLCSCLHSGGPSNITAQGDRLEATIKAPIARAGVASRDAMVQQKMTIVAYGVTETSGRIVAYTSKGARIELMIHPVDANSSKITALTSGSPEIVDIANNLLAKIISKAS